MSEYNQLSHRGLVLRVLMSGFVFLDAVTVLAKEDEFALLAMATEQYAASFS